MTDMREYIISFPMFGEGFKIAPPASLSIFGFPLYLYGMIIGVGFLLAVLYCLKRSGEFGIKSDNLIDMLFFAVPSAVIMARVYYCVFEWEYYWANPAQIFSIRSGGLAIYGAVIGAVVAVIIFCRVKKIPAGALLDVGGFGLLIGQAVGRWGNFVNRECFGPTTDIFCRMGLTDPATGNTFYVHPAFLYESLWNILGFVLLHIFSKKIKRIYDGQLFIVYIGWYGLGRAFIEGIRTDSLYLWNTGIRASQLLAALSVIACAVLLVVNRRRFGEGSALWADSTENPLNAAASDESPEDEAQAKQ